VRVRRAGAGRTKVVMRQVGDTSWHSAGGMKAVRAHGDSRVDRGPATAPQMDVRVQGPGWGGGPALARARELIGLARTGGLGLLHSADGDEMQEFLPALCAPHRLRQHRVVCTERTAHVRAARRMTSWQAGRMVHVLW
jgi:hypothetical protein